MQSDTRIEDVLHTLADPEEFVRGILGNFGGFQKHRAVVRIGISGVGIFPHYCVEQGWETTKLLGKMHVALKGKEVAGYELRVIFNGRSHKAILEDQVKGSNWSSASMTFAEVQALLRRLRINKRTH